MSYLDDTPVISVLMPVYNGERFLKGAIESVLRQTYSHFEFIIIDDGSTDHTAAIIADYRDSRIRPFRNQSNLGLIASLNKGLDLARGKYIARMDSDDMCYPRRFERQLAFMEQNPDVGICGTWVRTLGTGWPQTRRYPTNPDDVRSMLVFHSALAHPTVLMRAGAIRDCGLRYEDEFRHAEDYAFWVKAARCFKLANIPEILLGYRVHASQVTVINAHKQMRAANRVRSVFLGQWGVSPTIEGIDLHNSIVNGTLAREERLFAKAQDWLLSLDEINRASGGFQRDALRRAIGFAWFRLCTQATDSGWWTLAAFYRSPLNRWAHLPLRNKVAFVLKCALRWRRRPLRTS